jgi:hypothetical protein
MDNLRRRFASLDEVRPPDLWQAIELRAEALGAVERATRVTTPTSTPSRRTTNQSFMFYVAAAALLLAVAAGAVVVGSGLVRQRAIVHVDLSPSPVIEPSPAAVIECAPAQPVAEPSADLDVGAWTPTGPMVNPRREGHTATFLTDGKVLVAGATDLGEAEIFDPESGQWTPTQSMLVPRAGHTASRLQDGRILVAGGSTVDRSDELASAELYDPESGTWSETGRMGVARAGAAAVLLPDCTVLVVGGMRNPDAQAEVYDPATGTWSPLPNPDQARIGAIPSMTLLTDGRALVSRGLQTASLYDSTTKTWDSTAPMVQLGSGFGTATLLADGRVLFAGGGMLPTSPFARRAQVYDPAEDTWTETTPMNHSHVYHTAALLPDGSVLVAGAGDGGFDGSAVAERYDPATDTWTVVMDMLQPHGWHAGTALHDGRVLVIGGYGDGRSDIPGAEVYGPSDGT